MEGDSLSKLLTLDSLGIRRSSVCDFILLALVELDFILC